MGCSRGRLPAGTRSRRAVGRNSCTVRAARQPTTSMSTASLFKVSSRNWGGGEGRGSVCVGVVRERGRGEGVGGCERESVCVEDVRESGRVHVGVEVLMGREDGVCVRCVHSPGR